jgi:hypothetical protein
MKIKIQKVQKQREINDDNIVIWSVYRVDVDIVVDVSEVRAASIFRDYPH